MTNADFARLADVPPEIEWFANINNAQTRRAYENALKDFMAFTGIKQPDEFRIVTRAHIIAWRDELAGRDLSGMTIRHRLAALSSLFEYLCEKNTVTHNPVKGVKRPPVDVVYKMVREYSEKLGFKIGAHSLRATAATNALDHQADIAKVQEWLGHANIATTRIYDHRKTRQEDSPTFKVVY